MMQQQPEPLIINVEVPRCGECVFSTHRRVKHTGTYSGGTKELVKCGVEDNPFLPESLRGGNYMSVRHFACEVFSNDPNAAKPIFKKMAGRISSEQLEKLRKTFKGLGK